MNFAAEPTIIDLCCRSSEYFRNLLVFVLQPNIMSVHAVSQKHQYLLQFLKKCMIYEICHVKQIDGHDSIDGHLDVELLNMLFFYCFDLLCEFWEGNALRHDCPLYQILILLNYVKFGFFNLFLQNSRNFVFCWILIDRINWLLFALLNYAKYTLLGRPRRLGPLAFILFVPSGCLLLCFCLICV